MLQCSVCQKPITSSVYVTVFWWDGVQPMETVMCQNCYQSNLKSVADLIDNHGGFVYRFGI
jgi:hypothetical protein